MHSFAILQSKKKKNCHKWISNVLFKPLWKFLYRFHFARSTRHYIFMNANFCLEAKHFFLIKLKEGTIVSLYINLQISKKFELMSNYKSSLVYRGNVVLITINLFYYQPKTDAFEISVVATKENVICLWRKKNKKIIFIALCFQISVLLFLFEPWKRM